MNNDIENHMVQPYADDEPFPSRDEPDGDDLRETLADICSGLSYEGPKVRDLDDKIYDLLHKIQMEDRVPHYETVGVLKDCLHFYNDVQNSKKSIASLADDFDAAAKRIESSLMGRKQA